MPTPKKPSNATPSRQSSILSFFNKTPTSATAISSPKATTSEAPPSDQATPKKKLTSVTLPRKNVEVSPNENEGTSSRKRGPVDSPDESVEEVKERPPPRRTATAAKKRRVILSDDDEDSDDADFAMDEESAKNGDESSEYSGSDASDSDESVVVTSDDEPATPKTPKNAAKKQVTPSSSRHRIVFIPSDEEEDVDMEAPRTPKSSAKSKLPSTPKTPGGTVKAMFDSFAAGDTPSKALKKPSKTKDSDFNDAEKYLHESFDFLKPEKIRDANKRRPDDPDYDPKTLYVPPDFLKAQTPGHQQFWLMKSKYFDTVIFFKVGKFYELYHMDAVTGIECLDLTPMRGAYAHAGFPEIAYGKYSDMLISRGLKVARVEQTETPAMLADRNSKAKGTKDKVVMREVCRVTTASTRTFGVLDGNDEKDFILSIEANANYLMALAEEQVTDKESFYGVCFVDTSVGRFIMTQFADDSCRSTLRTLIAQFQPCHVLFPKGQVSHGTQSVFNSALAAVKKEPLFDGKEFYSVDKTVSKLLEDTYLGSDLDSWPTELKKFLDTDLHVPKAHPDQELAVRALGGLMFYLQRCLIDVDVFSLRDFKAYTPPELNGEAKSVENTGRDRWCNKNLILDGATLLNLHLVPPFTGKKVTTGLRDSTAIKFSLLRTIDHCKTPFGKRLLRQWVCAPSCDAEVIGARQDAIEFLLKPEADGFLTKLNDALKKMPDLERLIQKIHTNGLKYRVDKHPDGRAQMFFATNYNKRKINDFITTLVSFEKLARLHKYFMTQFEDSETPALVDKCIGSGFPDVAADLKHFEQAFDRNTALETGVITPRRGVVADYDAALKAVDDAERAIQEYLSQERIRWKHQGIVLNGSGKTRYLLEFPDNVAPKLPASEYEFKSQRKGFKRYATTALVKLCNTLFAMENERDRVTTDVTRRVFEDFGERRNKWSSVVSQIAVLDCFASLATYASKCTDLAFPMCRPEFDFDTDAPFLEMRRGYHPLLMSGEAKLAKKASTFVPNDTVFGVDGSPQTVCLTGPNMGGKSTLMRQVAVLVVLAQMGSLVPADSFRLTPSDRIFSRIGAHDCSFAGQSTFYVELNETQSILRNATKDSFVVIDELGRGTSTNDGTAIAGAVLRELADNKQCRTFFSTHYFALCDLVKDNKNVKLAHMNFIVEKENSDDPTEEDIIFLYKLVDGVCKKSYGFFAAKLAGLPTQLVKEASEAGQLLEQQQERMRATQAARIAQQKKFKALRTIKEACKAGTVSVEELGRMIAAL